MITDEQFSGMPAEYMDNTDRDDLTVSPQGLVARFVDKFWDNIKFNDTRFHDQLDSAMQSTDGNTKDQMELIDKSNDRSEKRENKLLGFAGIAAICWIINKLV